MSFFDSNFIIPMNQSFPVKPQKLYSDRLVYPFSSVKIGKEESGFADIFKNAVRDVAETDRDYVNKQYLLATGQIDNAADVTIAGAKAQLAVDLLVQMRNSVLSAYNDILRINV